MAESGALRIRQVDPGGANGDARRSGGREPAGLPRRGGDDGRGGWRVRRVRGDSARRGPRAATTTGTAGDRIPRDHISIQLFTIRDQLAANFQGTLTRSARSATSASSTRGSSAGPPRSSRRDSTRPGCGRRRGTSRSHSRSTRRRGGRRCRTRGRCARSTSSSRSSASTSAPARWCATGATWAAFARDLNRAGRMARRDGEDGPTPTTTTGSSLRLTDDRRSTAFDVLVEETTGAGALRARPVLGHPRCARSRGHRRADRLRGARVPLQGHEPGGQLRGPRRRPDRLPGSSANPGRTSTSSSATTRVRRRGPRRSRWTPRAWASTLPRQRAHPRDRARL